MAAGKANQSGRKNRSLKNSAPRFTQTILLLRHCHGNRVRLYNAVFGVGGSRSRKLDRVCIKLTQVIQAADVVAGNVHAFARHEDAPRPAMSRRSNLRVVDSSLLDQAASAVVNLVLVAESHAGPGISLITHGEAVLGGICQMHFDEDFGASIDAIVVGSSLRRWIFDANGNGKRRLRCFRFYGHSRNAQHAEHAAQRNLQDA